MWDCSVISRVSDSVSRLLSGDAGKVLVWGRSLLVNVSWSVNLGVSRLVRLIMRIRLRRGLLLLLVLVLSLGLDLGRSRVRDLAIGLVLGLGLRLIVLFLSEFVFVSVFVSVWGLDWSGCYKYLHFYYINDTPRFGALWI